MSDEAAPPAKGLAFFMSEMTWRLYDEEPGGWLCYSGTYPVTWVLLSEEHIRRMLRKHGPLNP